VGNQRMEKVAGNNKIQFWSKRNYGRFISRPTRSA